MHDASDQIEWLTETRSASVTRNKFSICLLFTPCSAFFISLLLLNAHGDFEQKLWPVAILLFWMRDHCVWFVEKKNNMRLTLTMKVNNILQDLSLLYGNECKVIARHIWLFLFCVGQSFMRFQGGFQRLDGSSRIQRPSMKTLSFQPGIPLERFDLLLEWIIHRDWSESVNHKLRTWHSFITAH